MMDDAAEQRRPIRGPSGQVGFRRPREVLGTLGFRVDLGQGAGLGQGLAVGGRAFVCG